MCVCSGSVCEPPPEAVSSVTVNSCAAFTVSAPAAGISLGWSPLGGPTVSKFFGSSPARTAYNKELLCRCTVEMLAIYYRQVSCVSAADGDQKRQKKDIADIVLFGFLS